MRNMKKIVLPIVACLSMGTGAVQAATTFNNNFTMLSGGSGGLVGGTNDVVFTWDGTLNTNVNTAVSNAALTSVTPFFGVNWTAYNVMIYGPGTYTISTADTSGSVGCPTVPQPNCASGGNYSVTVSGGSIMAHMKFAWGSTQGIDVIDVWTPGSWTALNSGNPIFVGPGGVYSGPVYNFVSTDWDSNGVAGGAMIDGPFVGFNANFNVNAVPVPAAAWLFGSGLLGLLGLAKRKKKI